jgi:hypothetical protein
MDRLSHLAADVFRHHVLPFLVDSPHDVRATLLVSKQMAARVRADDACLRLLHTVRVGHRMLQPMLDRQARSEPYPFNWLFNGTWEHDDDDAFVAEACATIPTGDDDDVDRRIRARCIARVFLLQGAHPEHALVSAHIKRDEEFVSALEIGRPTTNDVSDAAHPIWFMRLYRTIARAYSRENLREVRALFVGGFLSTDAIRALVFDWRARLHLLACLQEMMPALRLLVRQVRTTTLDIGAILCAELSRRSGAAAVGVVVPSVEFSLYWGFTHHRDAVAAQRRTARASRLRSRATSRRRRSPRGERLYGRRGLPTGGRRTATRRGAAIRNALLAREPILAQNGAPRVRKNATAFGRAGIECVRTRSRPAHVAPRHVRLATRRSGTAAGARARTHNHKIE